MNLIDKNVVKQHIEQTFKAMAQVTFKLERKKKRKRGRVHVQTGCVKLLF